eukprot:403368879
MMHEECECVAQVIDSNKKLFFMYLCFENMFAVVQIDNQRTRWFRLSVKMPIRSSASNYGQYIQCNKYNKRKSLFRQNEIEYLRQRKKGSGEYENERP